MVGANDSTMAGLWVEEGRVAYRDYLPRPSGGGAEAVVAVALAGICGTDLELLHGYADGRGTPGHELVGTVVEGPGRWLGRRVVADINVGCGACARCARGDGNHCADRTVLGIRGRPGAFATHLAVPVANLHEVPDAVADEEAVFAEPLAAALRVPRQVPPVEGARWLVLGDGRLGQLVARVLAARDVDIVLAGRHEDKLRRARRHGIPTRAAGDPGRGDDFHVVVDCTGRPTGIEAARAAVRPGGTVVLKTTCAEPGLIDVSRLVVDEITLVGSRCGSIAEALEVLAARAVRVDDLIDARFPLEAGAAAFARAAEPGTLKVLLAPR